MLYMRLFYTATNFTKSRYFSMKSYICEFSDVMEAMTRIRPFVHMTPLITSSALDVMSGRNIFLKAENFQKTGSFKIRGATNAVLKMSQDLSDVKCVVTHSSGNHGQALAKAAQNAGIDCYVVMPRTSSQCKIDAVRGYGANVVLCEPSEVARKRVAEETLEKYGGAMVSASQDRDVIAGQGTVAMEILDQNPDVEVIVASVGGGGLISGIATAAKAIKPSIKVIAAEPEKANDCYVSKKAGILTPNPTFPETIADAVKVSVGSNTWPMVRDLVDDVITVTEEEIKRATLLVWERCKLVIEPTAGVAVAALLSRAFSGVKGQNVAVVLCGGNIDLKIFPELLKA